MCLKAELAFLFLGVWRAIRHHKTTVDTTSATLRPRSKAALTAVSAFASGPTEQPKKQRPWESGPRSFPPGLKKPKLTGDVRVEEPLWSFGLGVFGMAEGFSSSRPLCESERSERSASRVPFSFHLQSDILWKRPVETSSCQVLQPGSPWESWRIAVEVACCLLHLVTQGGFCMFFQERTLYHKVRGKSIYLVLWEGSISAPKPPNVLLAMRKCAGLIGAFALGKGLRSISMSDRFSRTVYKPHSTTAALPTSLPNERAAAKGRRQQDSKTFCCGVIPDWNGPQPGLAHAGFAKVRHGLCTRTRVAESSRRAEASRFVQKEPQTKKRGPFVPSRNIHPALSDDLANPKASLEFGAAVCEGALRAIVTGPLSVTVSVQVSEAQSSSQSAMARGCGQSGLEEISAELCLVQLTMEASLRRL